MNDLNTYSGEATGNRDAAMTLALLGKIDTAMQPFVDRLGQHNYVLTELTGEDDLQLLLACSDVAAVLAHEHDFPLLCSCIMRFPLLNYALISGKPTEAFHQMTEGYGIFMQLPLPPAREDADTMLAKLDFFRALVPAPVNGEKK